MQLLRFSVAQFSLEDGEEGQYYRLLMMSKTGDGMRYITFEIPFDPDRPDMRWRIDCKINRSGSFLGALLFITEELAEEYEMIGCGLNYEKVQPC